MNEETKCKLQWTYISTTVYKDRQCSPETEIRFLVGTVDKALEYLKSRIKMDVDDCIESVENYRGVVLRNDEDGISGDSRVEFQSCYIEYKLVAMDETWFEVLE